MHIRCPTSTYLGVARLPNYHWIINDRGYANVVETPPSTTQNPQEDYSDVVFGLVYGLEPEDEQRLDKNEGVPEAYTKEELSCDFWRGTTERRVDTGREPDAKVKMLVYIDQKRVEADEPRKEYIYRMNKGIADALGRGVPEQYVEDVMRKFIPAEEGEQTAHMEAFAQRQAAQFSDESGVF